MNPLGLNGVGRTTHGYARQGDQHPLYRVWNGMICRCETPSSGGYENYGGRGIMVCDEWRHDFVAFKEWAMANGWKKGLHIDRKDNDGNYSPDNCRFVTAAVNARNKRSSRFIEFKGETLLLADWSERLDIPYGTLAQRIYILKWTIERALTEPVRMQGKAVPK